MGRVAPVATAAAALLLSLAVGVVDAKYEEEAGRWDWHKEVFGGLRAVAFKSTGKKAFFGAKDGLLGAVGKGGVVSWRRLVGPQCDAISAITHSGSGNFVLAVCSNGVVNAFSSEGGLLWSSQIDLAEHDFVVGVSGQTEDEWASVIVATPSKLVVHPVVAEDGFKWGGSSSTPPPHKEADLRQAQVSDSSLYVAVGDALHSLTIASVEWSKSALPGAGWRVVSAARDAVVLRNDATRKCLEDGVERDGGDVCIPRGFISSSTLFSAEQREAFGGIQQAFTEGATTILKMASGDTVGVVDGQVAWVRDDGLGDVVDAVALSLVDDDEDEEHRGAWQSYLRLVRHQFEGIKEKLLRLPVLVEEAVGVVLGGAAKKLHKRTSVEIQFALQRSFLLSSRHTLFRVSSEDGSITFRRHIDSLVYAGTQRTGAHIVKVFTSPAADGEAHSPHVFVWARDADTDYVVTLFDHHEEAKVRNLKGHMSDGAVIPHFTFEDSVGVQCTAVAFTAADGTVVVHPPTAQTSDKAFHLYRVSEETGALVGYQVQDGTAKVSWRTRVTSSPDEKVVATSLQTWDFHKFVLTDNIKVQGNTSSAGKTEVMSKYTNPNAVLIVTAMPPRSAPASQDEPAAKREAYLVLYLVDGVTGAILNSMVQPNAVGPVSVVAMEHMYLVHFFNTKRRRYQMTVMELFEDTDRYRGLTGESTTNLKQIWNAFLGFKSMNLYSSYEVAPPQMIPTAFTFPVGVTALGVTVSELGVASKQLLAALTTDEIVSIDLQKHMEANAATGISAVAWLPTSTVSYYRTVVGTKAIKTFPTKLESTTLMLAHGNDIFFSRVTSGKPFDMLNEDFGYTPLVLTVAATILLTSVTSFLATRTSQKALWA